MTDRQESGLLLRQRANTLREGAIGNEDSPDHSANILCARELEAMAVKIESGDVGEAPLAESVWLHEVATLRRALATAEADGAELMADYSRSRHELATLTAQLTTPKDDPRLLDLLAIIHGDGGHHTDDVGVGQSVTDARAAWYALRAQDLGGYEAIGYKRGEAERKALQANLESVMEDRMRLRAQLATAKADALKAARDAVVISCPECCRHIDKTDEDGCCLVCGTDVVHDGNGAAYDWWLTVCAIDQLLHAATNPRNP